MVEKKPRPATELLNLITLGCSKNLVDSEHIMRQLNAAGIATLHDAPLDAAPAVVINTCGFIHDARQESIDMILRCVRAKNDGLIRHLFVIGCLSELYKKELKKEIPEADRYFGARNLQEIIRALAGDYRADLRNERVLTGPVSYAYLKIAEGCSRTCAFCAIPRIRGRHVSVPPDDLLAEARFLAGKGVRELVVISQDITYYGLDLCRRQMLPELLRQLCRVDGIERIRLHYAYPNRFPPEVIELMQREPKICRYIDIPIQHISDVVLRKMRRNITGAQITELIARIRNAVPGIALRTTLITGHPGETAKEFEQLLRFVAQTRFERLGVFTYSHEDNTFAGRRYRDTIPARVKRERADRIMALQRSISEEHNRAKIGNTYPTLIDRREGDFYIGRTEYDAPEVDGEVLVSAAAGALEPGGIYPVRIDACEEYDLYGTALPHTKQLTDDKSPL